MSPLDDGNFSRTDANSTTNDEPDARERASTLTHALDYAKRGWHVFPLAAASKEPLKDWEWSKKAVPLESVPLVFGDFPRNIGIALGCCSDGLVDIDLDWPEARLIAEAMGAFAELPAFGRCEARHSHRVAICSDEQKPRGQTRQKRQRGGVRKFQLPSALKGDPRLPPAGEHPLCVAELRGTGGYSMFPGSVHPNGEAIHWEPDLPEVIPELSWDDLEGRVGLVAFLALVLRFYPGGGSRDEMCMALTGTLLRVLEQKHQDSAVERVDHLVKLVARLANDEEWERRGKAAATWRKMQAGEPVTGFPRLMQLLGVPQDAAIRRWLGAGVEVDGLPVISLGQDLRCALDRAEAALKAQVPIYQRGGNLVRVYRLDADVEPVEGVRRQTGSLTIDEVEPYWLCQQLQKVATFVSGGEGKQRRVTPTIDFCKHYIIGRRGEWRLPVLTGIIEAPTVRPDGTLLQQPGFDRSTGLFLDFGSSVISSVREQPTRDDASRALESLANIIRGFPFIPDTQKDDWHPTANEGSKPSASRSVFLSAVLSGLMRRSLRAVPLHAFDAPAAGTGKGKLADIITSIVTGRPANVLSQGGSEEENEKRLFASLWAGDPVVVIDNIERPLEGAALCSILTQENWQSRILGKSKNVPVATSALFLATGNHLIFRGDLTRRVVVCRLDARAERPDDRQFDFDPVDLAQQRRPELVTAGLTILRAYFAAGRPLQKTLPDVGSFKDWTLIREVLVWLDQPDPSLTRQPVLDNDPKRDELAQVIDNWERCFDDKPLTLAEVTKRIERAETFATVDASLGDLGRTLRGLTRNGDLNVKSLGWWFRRNTMVVVRGRQFCPVSRGSAGERVYRLVQIQNTSPSTKDESSGHPGDLP